MIEHNKRKAKPIFPEEKEFIESHLPEIELPDNCWITGGGTKFIWLDLYAKTFWLKFKCEPDGHFTIITDNRDKFRDYKQATVAETIEREKERITELYNKCVARLKEYLINNPDRKYSLSISGGKDSELTMAVYEDAAKQIENPPGCEYLFFNTSNEVADVYKRIKQISGIRIVNPEIGWRQWIKNQNYSFPTIFRRSCCSTYKEGQVKKIYDKNEKRAQIMGVRQTESNKRSKYQFLMDCEFDTKIFGKSNFPRNWIKLAPITELETVDVWLLILLKNLPINRRYRIGCSRVGCLICPYSNTYEDEISRTFYKPQWNWFAEAITNNYEIYNTHTLGWSLDEWINGKWKNPIPKFQIVNQEPTPENIKALADRKGLSEEMAAKYFNKYCGVCEKKCTENEIGMFLKLFGRYEGQTDNRKPLCKKCMCKELNITKKEYSEMLSNFYNQGCSLF